MTSIIGLTNDSISSYVLKVEKEIDRLKKNGKKYWWDFDLDLDKKNALVRKFSGMYIVEFKKCAQCRNSYEVTITISQT